MLILMDPLHVDPEERIWDPGFPGRVGEVRAGGRNQDWVFIAGDGEREDGGRGGVGVGGKGRTG